jgi:hypothetical protein
VKEQDSVSKTHETPDELARRMGLPANWRETKAIVHVVTHRDEYTPACLMRAVYRFHQVTPEDVAWAETQSAFNHSLTMPRPARNYDPELGMYVLQNGKPRKEPTICYAAFFAKHRQRREAQYANDRALQALAESLGDEWAAAHPKMEASLSFFKP